MKIYSNEKNKIIKYLLRCDYISFLTDYQKMTFYAQLNFFILSGFLRKEKEKMGDF